MENSASARISIQKGRDIKAPQGKGQGAVLAKNGQFASYKEKETISLLLGSIKCFPFSFNTFKTLQVAP
jgi:hypothetical protein